MQTSEVLGGMDFDGSSLEDKGVVLPEASTASAALAETSLEATETAQADEQLAEQGD